MIIELEINGARVIVSGENLSVSVTECGDGHPDSFVAHLEPPIEDLAITDMSDVFKLFESNIELAGVLNVGQSTVSEMKRRKNIPPQYWRQIVAAVAEKGREDLTFEKFVELASKRAAREVTA